MTDTGFWLKLDRLVADAKLIVDRPRGSPHPHYPDLLYPLDYGFLEGTCSADGEGIDVWIGGQARRAVTGIICTADLQNLDAEIKILIGCTPQEVEVALRAHNHGSQAGILVQRDTLGDTATNE